MSLIIKSVVYVLVCPAYQFGWSTYTASQQREYTEVHVAQLADDTGVAREDCNGKLWHL